MVTCKLKEKDHIYVGKLYEASIDPFPEYAFDYIPQSGSFNLDQILESSLNEVLFDQSATCSLGSTSTPQERLRHLDMSLPSLSDEESASKAGTSESIPGNLLTKLHLKDSLELPTLPKKRQSKMFKAALAIPQFSASVLSRLMIQPKPAVPVLSSPIPTSTTCPLDHREKGNGSILSSPSGPIILPSRPALELPRLRAVASTGSITTDTSPPTLKHPSSSALVAYTPPEVKPARPVSGPLTLTLPQSTNRLPLFPISPSLTPPLSSMLTVSSSVTRGNSLFSSQSSGDASTMGTTFSEEVDGGSVIALQGEFVPRAKSQIPSSALHSPASSRFARNGERGESGRVGIVVRETLKRVLEVVVMRLKWVRRKLSRLFSRTYVYDTSINV